MSTDQGDIRGNAFVNGKLQPGTVRVDGANLLFTGNKKETLIVPLNGITLRFGGHDESQIFFEHASAAGQTVTTSDSRILQDPFFTQPPYRDQIARFQKRQKRIPAVAYLFGGIAAFIIIGVLSLFLMKDAIVRWVTDKIPTQWEQKFGDQAVKSIESSNPFLTDEAYLSKLTAITNRLIPAAGDSGWSFRFYVIKDTNINAFAIPGGHVVIHTGLLDAASSKEEIAGVLAHEIAHVTQRHSFRKIVESAGMFLLVQALLGDTEGVIAILSERSSTLLQQKFSRDFEREADDKGWEYLLKARIDPRGMTSFFNRLLEVEKSRDAMGMNAALGILSTHPPTTERIERLTKKWDAVQSKDAFEKL